jgi:membrane protease YdiL (CAAX protease family)
MDFPLYVRLLVPFLIAAVYACILVYKKEILAFVKKKPQKKRCFLRNMIKCLRLDLGDWRFTILLPAILIIVLEVSVARAFGMPLKGQSGVYWFDFATSGLLHPISEEFLIRGLLLGGFFTWLFPCKFKNKKLPQITKHILKHGITLIGVLFSSLVFAISHYNPIFFHFAIRFSASILFSLLYLASGRNLLPPIVAHAAGNLYILLS